MVVALRHTTAGDLEFVTALEHHPDQRPYIGQWTREQHLDSIRRSDHEHWIIAGDDGSPLGYLIAYDVQAAGYGIYIKRIALAAKSTGAGRAALRLFLTHAFQDLRASSVCLAVRDYNARAQRAYAAVGFTVLEQTADERRAMTHQVDQFPDECLVMKCTLRDAKADAKPDAKA